MPVNAVLCFLLSGLYHNNIYINTAPIKSVLCFFIHYLYDIRLLMNVCLLYNILYPAAVNVVLCLHYLFAKLSKLLIAGLYFSMQ